MAPKPVTVRRQAVLNIALEDYWPLISDTGQTNFAIGLPELKFTPQRNSAGSAEMIGSTEYFGIKLRWIERPFEWIRPHSFQVERIFIGNPLLHSVITGARIEARGENQVWVESFAILKPKNLLGALAARLQGGRLVEGHFKYAQRLAEVYTSQRSDYIPPMRRVKVDEAALAQKIQQVLLNPVDRTILDRISAILRTGRDEDVVQMRPFAIADRDGLDRLDTLRVFLYATQAGMLDMNWDMLCPNCRVSRESATSLRNLRQGSHCDTCNISYDINFDEYVELRFSVNPAIRLASSGAFCIGGPANSRHIVGQQMIPAGGKRTLAIPLVPGTYRLRILGSEIRTIINVDSTTPNSEAQVLLSDQGLQPPTLALAPGPITFHTTSAASHENLLILERDAWGTQQVSAAFVTTLPEFRTLFSSEVLAPDLGLSIKNITLFFSDLKDSTPMYEQIGDSSAFALVRDHFTILFAAIRKHDGSVVKTIGDAVMAVFSTTQQAVSAALEIQARIVVANQARGERPPLILKVGLHCGPCIAVNANEVLDYFGTTVNAAARAQSVSVGDDIVLTDAVMQAAGVEEILGQHRLLTECFTRDLKGLSNSYKLYRITPLSGIEMEPAALS